MEKEKEVCIKCGNETSYEKTTPINLRFCYVEGAGQLCSACYKIIYPD